MTAAWRLLLDGPADGAWNMAADESLLETYAASSDPTTPTLRLYSWSRPTVSLGRQQSAKVVDLHRLRDHGVGLVRRPTGGQAVLHEHERTFAVVGTLRRPPFDGGVLGTYRLVAHGLRLALGLLGLDVRLQETRGRDRSTTAGSPVCFSRASAYEILAGDRKLVGSAQLRRRGAFLNHGSILLRTDVARHRWLVGDDGRERRFTDLSRSLGREMSSDELDDALVRGFTEAFGVELAPARLSTTERVRATHLRAWKYLSAGWTLAPRAFRPRVPQRG